MTLQQRTSCRRLPPTSLCYHGGRDVAFTSQSQFTSQAVEKLWVACDFQVCPMRHLLPPGCRWKMEHGEVGLLVRGQSGEESCVLFVMNASGVAAAAGAAGAAATLEGLDGCRIYTLRYVTHCNLRSVTTRLY